MVGEDLGEIKAEAEIKINKQAQGALGAVSSILERSIVDEATGLIIAEAPDKKTADKVEKILNNRQFTMVK